MQSTTSVGEAILDRFDSLMRHAAVTHAPEFLDADVTMSQAKVLYLVSLRPGVPMSALASALGVGLPAASGIVDRLVSLGYLGRREDPADRRQQLVTVTAAGSAALDRLRELNTEGLRRLIRGLDSAELDALLLSLSALDREVQRLELPEPPPAAQPEAQPERTPA